MTIILVVIVIVVLKRIRHDCYQMTTIVLMTAMTLVIAMTTILTMMLMTGMIKTMTMTFGLLFGVPGADLDNGRGLMPDRQPPPFDPHRARSVFP